MDRVSLDIAMRVFDGAVQRAFDEGVAAGVDEGELASLFLQIWDESWESWLWRKMRPTPPSPPSISAEDAIPFGDDIPL